MHKVTDPMLSYAFRLAIVLLAGWLLVGLVYKHHSIEPRDEQQSTPSAAKES
jgi:hypothetical protein